MRKEKGADSVQPFHINLKRMLLRHTMQRILQVEIICIFLVTVFLLVWGIRKTHQVNASVRAELNETLGAYGQLLDSVAGIEQTAMTRVSSTWQYEILERYYRTLFFTGIPADLYLFDADGRPYISNLGYLSEKGRNTITLQRRTLLRSTEQPERLQLSVSRGAERALLLGRGICGSEQGNYVLLKIEEKALGSLFSGLPIRSVLAQEDDWALSPEPTHFLDAIHRLRGDLRGRTGITLSRDGLYYVVSGALSYDMLRLYSFWDMTPVFLLLTVVFMTTLIVSGSMLRLSRLSVEKVAAEFTEDIRTLQEAFTEAYRGNLNHVIDIRSSSEMMDIGHGYNGMLESLRRQMQDNEELAKIVADEQVKQLGSQFTAHFLFNTLDNIYYMCSSSPEMAERMVLALADLLRYNTHSPNGKVTLSEDLHYIGIYLDIIKIRFQEAFTYQIHVEEGLGEFLIPKLLMQPVLENALKYGRISRDVTVLSLCVRREGEKILLECRDNGLGIEPALLLRIQENLKKPENRTSHLGLYNVHRRVQLAYGEEFGLKLINDDGLLVTVTIPVETELQL